MLSETEDWQQSKSDGIKSREEEWLGEKRCRGMVEGFQCRGETVRQRAGFVGNDDEGQEHNPN